MILSVDEIRPILARLRRWRYRMCLSMIYACWLHLQEGLYLQVSYIDSDRRLVHICHRKGGKDSYVLPKVWGQDWVVYCKPVGDGCIDLKCLAPYIFRIAISNRLLGKLEHDQVTLRYRISDTGRFKLCILSAEEFIHRFLQHVLPNGFVKVRYFGFFAPGCRKRLAALSQLL